MLQRWPSPGNLWNIIFVLKKVHLVGARSRCKRIYQRNPNQSWSWSAMQKAAIIPAPKLCAASGSCRQGQSQGFMGSIWDTWGFQAVLQQTSPTSSDGPAWSLSRSYWTEINPKIQQFLLHSLNSKTFFEHFKSKSSLYSPKSMLY